LSLKTITFAKVNLCDKVQFRPCQSGRVDWQRAPRAMPVYRIEWQNLIRTKPNLWFWVSELHPDKATSVD